jgi:tRNA (mo5U34)-methyltransferase
MELEAIERENTRFAAQLSEIKARIPDVQWYPYGSSSNFIHLENHFRGAGRGMFSGLAPGFKIVDIGAADGDTAFFLENLGADVTIIDNVSTNYNDCRGIKRLTQELGSKVELREIDLDFATTIPGKYDLALFLGILYHLRNPMMALTALAETSKRMVMSTVVFSCLPDGTNVESLEMSSLVPTRAINDDPTNYWTSTPANLRTWLKRAGWRILDEFRIGDVGTSTMDGRGLERMFCYCERVANWQHLRLHHDF